MKAANASDAGFKPFWTQRWVLICFALCFIAVIASLEAILKISDKHLGLANTDLGRHYIWVYGPTAIFTAILALWARVDYRLRQMTPWFSIEGRKEYADVNLWKDYLTSTMPEIIWYSIKEGDYAVASGSLVVAFVTLLMVISTGLFSLEPRPIYLDNVPYQLTSRFNDSSISAVSASLILDVMDGIDAKTLAYPFGVTPDTVYSNFVSDSNRGESGTLQSVVTDVVRSEVQCIPAKLNMATWNNTPPRVGFLVTDNCTFELLYMNELFNNETTPQYFGTFTQYTQGGCGTANSTSLPIGVVFGEAGPIEDADSQSNMTIGVLRSNQYLCWPNVVQASAQISLNRTMLSSGSFPNITIIPGLPVRHPISRDKLTGGSNANPSIALAFSYLSGGSNPVPTLDGQTVRTTTTIGQMPKLLQHASARGLTIDDVLDSDVLAELASDYAQRALTLWAYFGLQVSDAEEVNGTMTANENRLVVQSLPVRLLQGFSCAVVVSVLIAIAIHPNKRLRVDPAPLAGSLIMLGCHVSMQEQLSGTSALDVCSTQMTIVNAQPKTHDNFHHINTREQPLNEHSHSQEIVHESEGSVHECIKWWKPIITTRRARIGMSVLVCLTVVALEVLLWYSTRLEGLATVSNTGSIHLAWSIPPAALMVAVAMYFRALGSQYKLLAPYVRLRSGDADGRILFHNYSSRTEPEAFLLSVANIQWSTALITFSVFLSAFLTIIMSGVWTASPVPAQQESTTPATTWFNMTTTDAGKSGDNAWIASSLLTFNISYPKWTYEDLVFPSMNIVTDFRADSVRAKTPALRTTLNCTLYTEAQLFTQYRKVNIQSQHDGSVPYTMTIGFPVKGGCDIQNNTAGAPVAQPGGQWATFHQSTVKNCPLINFYWGWQDVNSGLPTSGNGTPATYARVLSCDDVIEKIDTETTFTLPEYEVDDAHPPKIVSTPEVYSTASIPTTYDAIEVYNASLGIAGPWSVLANRYGVSINDLKDPSSVDKITAGIKAMHGIVRAQQYHAALRNNASSLANAPQELNVTLLQSDRWRLIQNAISTHVLCGVLCAMLICLAVASADSSINKILPKNPGSIGAQMSLIADSNILKDEVLMQDIDRSLRDRKALKILDGHKFRMGWFESRDSGKMIWTINRVEPTD